MTPKNLAKELRNIGPVMAKRLLEVRIDSLEELRKVGVKETYKRLCARKDFCGRYHASYLYALEGALLGCDWRAIPEAKREAYKALTASLREASRGAPSEGVLRLPK